MKVAILLALIAISMAASFDDVKAIIHEDQCAIEGLEYIKPKIHTQIQKLKEVLFQFKIRTQTTSLPRLNSWCWSKRLKEFSKSATLTKRLNQFWAMLSRLLVLDSSSPQTASRMSEPSSWSLIQSLKTQVTSLTTSSSSSSSLFWEDKLMPTVNNSSDTSCDFFIEFEF